MPLEGIVEVQARPQERAVDRTIAELSRDGIYRTSEHFARVRGQTASDPQRTIDVHVRRLEALRRAAIVERLAEGVWRVPTDFISSGAAYDARRTGELVVDVRSRLPVERQTRALGATWLDRQLLSDRELVANRGFGEGVHQALEERLVFLQEQGLAERRGQRVVLSRNLLSILRDREVASVAQSISAEVGLVHRPAQDGAHICGVYRRDVQLISGRFAMLDDGTGFSLIPWNSALEQRIGRSVTATIRGATATWDLRRDRDIAL